MKKIEDIQKKLNLEEKIRMLKEVDNKSYASKLKVEFS